MQEHGREICALHMKVDALKTKMEAILALMQTMTSGYHHLYLWGSH